MDIDIKDLAARVLDEEVNAIALRVGRTVEEIYGVLSTFMPFYRPETALWLTEMHFVYGVGAYKHGNK